MRKWQKKLVLGSILAPLVEIWDPTFFRWNLLLLDVPHCCKLSLYTISSKTNEASLRKWQKNVVSGSFGPNSGTGFFFKNLVWSVTGYRGQLSSCILSKKNNDPILKKLSDGQTDGWTDGHTNE